MGSQGMPVKACSASEAASRPAGRAADHLDDGGGGHGAADAGLAGAADDLAGRLCARVGDGADAGGDEEPAQQSSSLSPRASCTALRAA